MPVEPFGCVAPIHLPITNEHVPAVRLGKSNGLVRFHEIVPQRLTLTLTEQNLYGPANFFEDGPSDGKTVFASKRHESLNSNAAIERIKLEGIQELQPRGPHLSPSIGRRTRWFDQS